MFLRHTSKLEMVQTKTNFFPLVHRIYLMAELSRGFVNKLWLAHSASIFTTVASALDFEAETSSTFLPSSLVGSHFLFCCS